MHQQLQMVYNSLTKDRQMDFLLAITFKIIMKRGLKYCK